MEAEAREILNKVNSLSHRKLNEYTTKLIKKRIKKAKEDNDCNYVGYDIDVNPSHKAIDLTKTYKEMTVGYNPVYFGFIPKDIKIIYELIKYENNKLASKGGYYYIDDTEYIYQFMHYIKDKRIEDDYTLIRYAFDYTMSYLGYMPLKERDEINKLIYKTYSNCYMPIKEHSITDFKGNGSGECSEISAILENILSMFNYDVFYLFGETHIGEAHAFNMIKIKDDDYMLIDGAQFAYCYDLENKCRRKSPYIARMEGFTDDDYKDFLYEKGMIETPDCYFTHFNKGYIPFEQKTKRRYKILSRKI